MNKFGKLVLSAFSGIPIALLYALLVRLTFGAGNFSFLFTTMTCGFLFLVPIAIGALTIRLAPDEFRKSLLYAAFMPWMSIAIVGIGSAAFAIEAAICILMAMPIFLVCSSFGGLLFRDKRLDDSAPPSRQNAFLSLILLAPYLVTPFEMKLATNDSYRIVENEISINAPANVVWENMIMILPINSVEQQFSIFHVFGIPKLKEATLTYRGLGGMRSAVFENGLTFTETIIYWNENQRVKFAILPSNLSTAPPPYNMIGGEYLAVTEMDYWIEEIDHNNVVLHLRSQHRLSTHFNSYAALWTELMLKDVQAYALHMIKNRSESMK